MVLDTNILIAFTKGDESVIRGMKLCTRDKDIQRLFPDLVVCPEPEYGE